jgi:hypothetical protein
MYKEYLGEGYHDRIRKMLTADESLLPDRIIDAENNIGAMKMLIAPALEKMSMQGKRIDTDQKYNQLSNAAVYYLCGILCMAMKSRTSAPPYNTKKHQRNWDKKRIGYIQKGNLLMEGLKRMGPSFVSANEDDHTGIQDVSRPGCRRFIAHINVDSTDRDSVKAAISATTQNIQDKHSAHVVWLYVHANKKLVCRTMWVDKTLEGVPLPKPLDFNDSAGDIGIVWL